GLGVGTGRPARPHAARARTVPWLVGARRAVRKHLAGWVREWCDRKGRAPAPVPRRSVAHGGAWRTAERAASRIVPPRGAPRAGGRPRPARPLAAISAWAVAVGGRAR